MKPDDSVKRFPLLVDAFFQETNQFFEALAKALGLDPSQFRPALTLPAIPDSDVKLSNLLDLVVGGDPSELYIASDRQLRFSREYDRILHTIVVPGRVLTRAKEFYANPNNWYPSQPSKQPKVGENPIYVPTVSQIKDAIKNGATLKLKFDTATNPVFPVSQRGDDKKGGFISNFWGNSNDNRLRALDKVASTHRLVVEVNVSRFANPSIQMGNWFYAGLLSTVYGDQNEWPKDGGTATTWNQIFGPQGTLKFFTVSVIVASGFSMKLRSYGEYDADAVTCLQNPPRLMAWPFYCQNPNAKTVFTLNPDKSLTVEMNFPPDEIRIMGFCVSPVAKLM